MSCATISSACAASMRARQITGEFRDIVGRIEDLSAQLAAHNDAVMRRLDAIQGIASDNGVDEGEGERAPEPEDDDIDDITARDWDDLADELNI